MTALLRETVGDVLRRTRRSQGRTLREVAASARVSLGYLSEVERGRKEASSELLGSICAALNLPLSSVLFAAGRRLAQEERGGVPVADSPRVDAPHIDTTTKVVIPPLAAMAPA